MNQAERAAGHSRERLLLISYQFPPLGGVGVQRALSLAKFFPQCDYEVDVLTPSNGVSHTYDSGLEREVPSGVKVHRSMTPEIPFSLRRRLWGLMGGGKKVCVREANAAGAAAAPARRETSPKQGLRTMAMRLARRLVFPDPQFGWRYTAGPRAVDLIRRRGITTVVVTVPPFSTLAIIKQIKRELPHVTVVADFRDEWLEYYLKEIAVVKDNVLRDRAMRFQREAVAAADLVVAVTQSSLNKLKSQSPGEPASKFAVIPNGYDHTKVRPLAPKPRLEGRPIKVVYIGTVYKPCTPCTYLDALDQLPEPMRSRFETTFVGRVEEDQRKYLNGRKSKMDVQGFLPQNEALRRMEDADYLLLPLTEESVLPGKVYEYLATGKPILALTPVDGELGKLMKETLGGYCVDHEDVAGITALLESIATGTAEPVQPNAALVNRYRRLNLAERYAKLIRGVQLGVPVVEREPAEVAPEPLALSMAAGAGK